MSKEEKKNKPKVRSVKENLWRLIDQETDKLKYLLDNEKKHKQVA